MKIKLNFIGRTLSAIKRSRLSQHSIRLLYVGILTLLTVLAGAYFSYKLNFDETLGRKYNLQLDQISPITVISEFDFDVMKSPDVLEKERDFAVLNTPLLFNRNNLSIEEQAYVFNERFQRNSDAVGQVPGLKELGRKAFNRLKKSIIAEIRGNASYEIINLEELENFGYEDGIKKLKAFNEKSGKYLDIKKYKDIKMLLRELLSSISESLSDEDVYNFFLNYLSEILSPTLNFDYNATKSAEEQALASVSKAKNVVVLKGEEIIRAHQKVTQDKYDKLFSYELMLSDKAESDKSKITSQKILYFLYSLIWGLALYFFYILYFKTRSNYYFVLLMQFFFINLMIVTSFILLKSNISYLLLPMALVPLISAIYTDYKISMATTIYITLVLFPFVNFTPNFILFSFSGSLFAIYSVKNIVKRSNFFKTAIYLFFALFASIFFIKTNPEIINLDAFTEALLYAAVNSLLVVIISIGLQPFIETIFRISSNFTYLELANLEHPLLKELSLQAGGTYFHSVLVSNLSENAAKAIGANPILAKVGALYHDIGKVNRAEYFGENISSGKNIHDKLSPSMSALIVKSHVKDGLELAQKYNLPAEIKEFITQHHGKSFISFFYHKAQKQNTREQIEESNYRYDGPKPNSKEVAICMIADNVESIVRSLEVKSPSEIKDVIKTVIDGKFTSNELSESKLTLHELKLIGESFFNVLKGIYHKRIDYPKEKEDETSNENDQS